MSRRSLRYTLFPYTTLFRSEPSAPYTQNQNGVSERKIRSIVEKARCMLHDASLGARFWAEAVSTAVYLLNRSPTRARSEEHTSELQSLTNLVCRLLLEKKNN